MIEYSGDNWYKRTYLFTFIRLIYSMINLILFIFLLFMIAIFCAYTMNNRFCICYCFSLCVRMNMCILLWLMSIGFPMWTMVNRFSCMTMICCFWLSIWMIICVFVYFTSIRFSTWTMWCCFVLYIWMGECILL